jgi:hypothetical protein
MQALRPVHPRRLNPEDPSARPRVSTEQCCNPLLDMCHCLPGPCQTGLVTSGDSWPLVQGQADQSPVVAPIICQCTDLAQLAQIPVSPALPIRFSSGSSSSAPEEESEEDIR